MLAALLAFVVFLLPTSAAPFHSLAPASSLDRTLAVLDAVLPVESAAPAPATTSDDEARIYLGDQGYRPDTLRAWRAQLVAARAAIAAQAEQAASAPTAPAGSTGSGSGSGRHVAGNFGMAGGAAGRHAPAVHVTAPSDHLPSTDAGRPLRSRALARHLRRHWPFPPNAVSKAWMGCARSHWLACWWATSRRRRWRPLRWCGWPSRCRWSPNTG